MRTSERRWRWRGNVVLRCLGRSFSARLTTVRIHLSVARIYFSEVCIFLAAVCIHNAFVSIHQSDVCIHPTSVRIYLSAVSIHLSVARIHLEKKMDPDNDQNRPVGHQIFMRGSHNWPRHALTLVCIHTTDTRNHTTTP